MERSEFEKEINLKIKKRRFKKLCHLGVEVALLKGLLVRWFILTESNEALEAGMR